MITVWAGRLTPQASVAVQTKTWIRLQTTLRRVHGPPLTFRVVNGEAERQEISQVAVLHVASFLRQDLSNRTVRLDELGNRLLRSFFARVDEHQRLVLARLVEDLLVTDFVGDLVPLNRFLLRDTDEMVKVEKPLLLINPKEGCNVLVIGQCSRKAKEADVLGLLFRPPDSPSDDTLQNRSSLVVEKMYFINDDEAHEVGIRSVDHFPRDDIPFLRRGHDDLSSLRCFASSLRIVNMATFVYEGDD
jgi:hypothetical protein